MYIHKMTVLSADYKWEKNEIMVMFGLFKKFYIFHIPYWIKRSRLDDKTIQQFKNFYDCFNVETEEMEKPDV